MAHEILTDELLAKIEQQDRDQQSEWLFLEQSGEFRGYWQVDGLWPEYFIDLEPLIGNYRLITPVGLNDFLMAVNELGYKPVFVNDPIEIIDAYTRLQETPLVSLQSTLPHTINGFLPWQVVGFNKLVRDEDLHGAYVVWCVGAGKTALIAAAINYHRGVGHPFDLALVVVKSHNKIDMQRKLKQLGGIDSVIIEGTVGKRDNVYAELLSDLENGKQVVAITNYEKFRNDTKIFEQMFKKRNLLCFWDEMPTKLSNPDTQLYKSVKKALYKSFSSQPHFKWVRHWALTATPIENSPGDVWANVNIMWPKLLGTRKQFEDIHVAYRNLINDKPQKWKDLDRLEAKIGFMTHRVSKEDPEVAEMFPTVIEKPTVIDWNPKHRAVYDKLTGKAKDLLEELEDANILAMIQVMQMVCDAPSMVRVSAQNRERFWELLEQLGDVDEGDLRLYGPKGSEIAVTLLGAVDPRSLTDVGHTKLDMWREIICEKHIDDKIVTHSTWAQYIFPVWEYWLQQWDVNYVVYTGTSKQRQQALDAFRTDPDIRVFLSGDAGADSIDIAEAQVGVNYNFPWKWTTKQQREGRRDRVNSTFDTIYTYDLIMPNSVDERKLEICEQKRQYHRAIFDGLATDEAISASYSRDELIYLLTGISGDE